VISERLKQQIDFIIEIDKLKGVIRKTKLFDGSRCENDVEHSWHLAMMAMVLSEYANEKVDVNKVMKMVLIHDLVEIDAGDVFIYDKNRSDQYEKEVLAAEKIFGMLPEDQATDLKETWMEFEKKESIEARFANALDRMEPLLQNYLNKGDTWKKFGISSEKVYKHNEQVGNGSNELWQAITVILNECVEKGYLESAQQSAGG
jgi:putative hydrolase of HD superfamily